MVVTAMGVNLAEDDGVCGERIIAFHERHAKGGAGLIVLGVAGVACRMAVTNRIKWRFLTTDLFQA